MVCAHEDLNLDYIVHSAKLGLEVELTDWPPLHFWLAMRGWLTRRVDHSRDDSTWAQSTAGSPDITTGNDLTSWWQLYYITLIAYVYSATLKFFVLCHGKSVCAASNHKLSHCEVPGKMQKSDWDCCFLGLYWYVYSIHHVSFRKIWQECNLLLALAESLNVAWHG